MSDLMFALLLLGVGAAAVVLPRLLETESANAGLLDEPEPAPKALRRFAVAHAVLFFFTLPLYVRRPEEGSVAGYLWFWLRTAGFTQALFVVPAWLREADRAERRRLLAAAKIAAAVSAAAVFVGLSKEPGPVARSAAAALAAIVAVLYGLYVASRARR